MSRLNKSLLLPIILAILAVVVSPRVTTAQNPATTPQSPNAKKTPNKPPQAKQVPTYDCLFTKEEITIDGKANEAAWKLATPVNEFTISWARDGKTKPPTATRAKLLWNLDYLYFFAEMDDSDIFANVTEHDGITWNNDVFEIFLKPAEDKPGYYEFQVNSANTTLDMYMPRRNAGGYDRFKSDGDFDFKTAVVLNGTLNKWEDKDQGWTAEGRLSWKDFHRTGGGPKQGDVWKFGLFRYDYSIDFEGPAQSTNTLLKTGSFHHHEDYSPIRFVGPK
jgi:hypothetical protein